MTANRTMKEIEHGKKIVRCAGKVWGWDTYAGRIRLARRVQMLTSHIEPGMNVLEMGCGTGYLTKELVKTKGQITAIDISPDLLKLAQDRVRDPKVFFKIEDAQDLSFFDESFDTIVGSSVLHHLDIDKALAEFYRVLKKNGTIYFTEPNIMNPQIVVQKNILLIKERMGDSPDETAFLRWSLKKKIRVHGFDKIRIRAFDFLHPLIPKRVVSVLEPICFILEAIPVLREIAGSLYIYAEK